MLRSLIARFGLWFWVVAGITGLAPSASAIVYDRNAAVAYANKYWNECVSDGYFWINGSTYTYYGAGAAVPVNAKNEDGGIGDDCAHFVSSCLGTPAGGLSIASRVPPTYGEPGAARLDELLISDGYGVQVSSISQLTPGDVIGYDWDGSGDGNMSGIDHTVIYLGNGKIDCHAASEDGVAWNWASTSSTITFFIHMTVADSIVPTTPTNTLMTGTTSLTPKLVATAFSDGAIGSTQIAAEWEVYKGASLIYDSGTDTTDLASLTVPANDLSAGNSYTWQVRYEDNYDDWSTYSTPTTFATTAVPEPAGLSLLALITVSLLRRRRMAPKTL